MAQRWEVREDYHYRNTITGQTASFYGATPYGAGWIAERNGFTVHNVRENTFGCYGMTHVNRFNKAEVQELCDRLNSL